MLPLTVEDPLDNRASDLAGALAWADFLRSLCPSVYYAPGNHEYRAGRADEVAAGLRGRGVAVLRNASAPLPGHPGVVMVGIDDGFTGHDDIPAAVRGVPDGAFAVAFTHAPELVERLGDVPVDLLLAGHTHGGQVRLPGLGALWSPGQGLLPRWDKGAYDLPGGRTLYIDSGYGTSIAPLRLFDRAQASIIQVKGT